MSNRGRQGIYNLQAYVSNWGDAVVKELEKEMTKAVLTVQSEASKNAPMDTGLLQNEIYQNVEVEGNEIIGRVGTNLHYAIIQELGSGPVGQENAASLPPGIKVNYRTTGWVYKGNRGFRYTRGVAPKLFMYRALEDNRQIILRNLKNAAIRARGD